MVINAEGRFKDISLFYMYNIAENRRLPLSMKRMLKSRKSTLNWSSIESKDRPCPTN